MFRHSPQVLGGLSLVASITCAWLALPRPSEALVAVSPVRDLGEVPQGATVAAEFGLVNRCREPIRIEEVLKGCDCVSPKVAKESLGPGERTTLTLRWETRARRGPSVTRMSVLYARKDGTKEITPLEIKADVIPDYDVQAPDMVFGPGRPSSRVVTFAGRRMPGLILSEPSCTHPAFKAVIAGKNAIRVTFAPPLWTEDVTVQPGGDSPDAELVVATNSKAAPICKVPLAVDRTRPIRAVARAVPR